VLISIGSWFVGIQREPTPVILSPKPIQDRYQELCRQLDACWCDDGRGDPECENCLKARQELKALGYPNLG
jgi:hypothetical protein